jgi:ubiquinone/menaquinone biosynthesis C-methylase UbiE
MIPPQRTPSQERWLGFWNGFVYNALAPLYNSMDWLTFGMWWRLVRRALDHVPPDGRVLEVAFGPGKLHAELAQRAALCVGIDLARGMCRYTKRRLLRAGLTPNIARGSVFDLPYAAGMFDVVVSTFAFSGFPDGAKAMHDMARVIRPGGSMVLVDIGLPLDGKRLGTSLARLWERVGDYLYDIPAMMADAGLTVTVFEEYGPGQHIRVVVGEK